MNPELQKILEYHPDLILTVAENPKGLDFVAEHLNWLYPDYTANEFKQAIQSVIKEEIGPSVQQSDPSKMTIEDVPSMSTENRIEHLLKKERSETENTELETLLRSRPAARQMRMDRIAAMLRSHQLPELVQEDLAMKFYGRHNITVSEWVNIFKNHADSVADALSYRRE